MKKQYRLLMVFGALVFSSVLWAEQGVEDGEVRGTFVRLAERAVEGQGYLAIVIKPLEGEEPVTLLVPRRREELGAFARQLRPGQKVEVVYVAEADQKWVRRIEAERRPKPEEREQALVVRSDIERRRIARQIEKTRARIAELRQAAEEADREGQHDKAAELREKAWRIAEELETHARKFPERRLHEAEQRIERLRHMANEAEERGEIDEARRLWNQAEELEREWKREFERRPEGVWRRELQRRGRPERPEAFRERLEFERRRPRPMEFEHRRERGRERHEPPGPLTHLELMQKELHDVLAEHLERTANEFRALLIRVERLERELEGLRAENMRLKSQLRERPRSRRGPEGEVRERRVIRRREEGRERVEARGREKQEE